MFRDLRHTAINYHNIKSRKKTLSNCHNSAMLNDYHSVILNTDGRVYSCGHNAHGQVGNGEISDSVPTFYHVPFRFKIVSTAIGYKHTLVVSESGELWGWGDNSYLQLGIDYHLLQNTSIPVRINDTTNVITSTITSSHHNTDNYNSSIISNSNGRSDKDCGSSGITNTYFISVAAGSNSSYAIDSERKVWCFGSNIHYQLGLWENSIDESIIPVSPLIISTTAAVETLRKENCVGTLTCNEYLDDIISITAGVSHVMCLDSKGKVKVFGTGNNGELGLGVIEVAKIPMVNYELPENIVYISSGNSHNLVVDNNNNVWGFGANWAKQLTFDESKTTFSLPITLGLPSTIVKVWCGSVSSYAKDINNDVWVFGDNEFGQLAMDTIGNDCSPKINPLLSNMEIIPLGLHLFVVNPITLELFSCGFNNSGQLGVNNNTDNINTNFSKSLQSVPSLKIPCNYHSVKSSRNLFKQNDNY